MIIHGISNTISNVIKNGGSLSKPHFHRKMQNNIARLSRKYGFSGIREYHVENRGNGRGGAIDVVWRKYPFIIAAIEIDSSVRKKSLFKLNSIDALYKIWVYYGNSDVNSIIDENPDIIVLHYLR